ncbi:hypothetical protein EXIGLDRAFT_763654 [Exidia glandulosa HHB12029]|uniref:RING-type domain-containing protein n=1 Tax=Exidia glandulosa HHB12029 TaxID=1314781 RepID=A0A165LUP7_EXIGL|nr:hypothetical protein EXIGLDRAFT_763654 [Exidia glandulosa HHB12029]
MFLVLASSTCDICLETYHSTGHRQPCVIPCGHIACRRCFQSLETPRCAYCRDEFYAEEVTGVRCEFVQPAPPGEDVPIPSAGAEDPSPSVEPATAVDLARECEARLSDLLLWDYSNRSDRVHIANDIRTFAEDFVVQHISNHYPDLIPTFDSMMQVVNNLDDMLESNLGRQEDQEDPDFAHEARQYRRSQRENGWHRRRSWLIKELSNH